MSFAKENIVSPIPCHVWIRNCCFTAFSFLLEVPPTRYDGVFLCINLSLTALKQFSGRSVVLWWHITQFLCFLKSFTFDWCWPGLKTLSFEHFSLLLWIVCWCLVFLFPSQVFVCIYTFCTLLYILWICGLIHAIFKNTNGFLSLIWVSKKEQTWTDALMNVVTGSHGFQQCQTGQRHIEDGVMCGSNWRSLRITNGQSLATPNLMQQHSINCG